MFVLLLVFCLLHCDILWVVYPGWGSVPAALQPIYADSQYGRWIEGLQEPIFTEVAKISMRFMLSRFFYLNLEAVCFFKS